MNITCGHKSDYAELTRLWEASVRATHDFLAEEDLIEIRDAMPARYLPAVQLYVLREEPSEEIVAFAGVSDDLLDMLFVDPRMRGRGFGSALLDLVCRQLGVVRVDVNEQNSQALSFYEKHGFLVVSRDSTDSAGRPYPILHMAKNHDR